MSGSLIFPTTMVRYEITRRKVVGTVLECTRTIMKCSNLVTRKGDSIIVIFSMHRTICDGWRRGLKTAVAVELDVGDRDGVGSVGSVEPSLALGLIQNFVCRLDFE